jgi:hypothetical protein
MRARVSPVECYPDPQWLPVGVSCDRACETTHETKMAPLLSLETKFTIFVLSEWALVECSC